VAHPLGRCSQAGSAICWRTAPPALAGSAIVNEGFRAIGLQQAMLIIPVLSVVLAIVLYFGSRSMVTDSPDRESISVPSHSLAS